MLNVILAAAGTAAVSLCNPATQTSDEIIGGYVAAVGSSTGVDRSEAAGMANLEHCAEIDGQTVFHIASLSKQITAAALAMAILDGRVALDDPVAKYIQEAAHYGETLTIAHLLYFTSGLTEAYALPRGDDRSWVTYHYFDVDEAIGKSLEVPELSFEPGTRWQYNNINYQLISEIVERAYAEPFSAVVEERIFRPLAMDQSVIHDDTTRIVPKRADGMIARTAGTIEQLASAGIAISPGEGPVLIRRNAPHYGGSGVLTSLEDWAKWQSEMLTGKQFGQDFWDLMFSTRRFNHPKANDAFGLVVSDFEGEPIVWFAGGDIDASAYMLASVEGERWAVCFSNNPSFDCQSKAQEMFRREEEGE